MKAASSDNDNHRWNTENDQPDRMITSKALALSLTPPRVPPFGTVQRSLYHASLKDDDFAITKPLSSSHQRYHVREMIASKPIGVSTVPIHQALHQKLVRQFQIQKHLRRTGALVHQPHPHLLEPSADLITRFIGCYWPVPQQNWVRDSGTFRWVIDALVSITGVPALALSNKPQNCILPFLRLTRICQNISYGSHRGQYIHLYPSQQEQTGSIAYSRRLIVFVHGGAWGSGHPWMYRLIAGPFVFSSSTRSRYSVAVLGYRTYPDSCSVADQVADLSAALNLLLTSQYSYLYDGNNITVVGHSSGAHIALILVVNFLKTELVLLEKLVSRRSSLTDDFIFEGKMHERLPFDSFCGISGPYDISHHFDYEASRGVEELSPMKPVNGFIRQAFQQNSPAWRLHNSLKSMSSSTEAALHRLCPHIMLIHGLEDDTVPFTATSEAGRLFWSLGITNVQELYIPGTGHQDAILQCMFSGTVSDEVIGWIGRNFDALPPSKVVAKRLAPRSRL